jgi:hypothetical protein
MLIDLLEGEKALIAKFKKAKFSYRYFIKSEYWRAYKAVWYSRHKKRCARCKRSGVNLHHKVYPKDGKYLALKDNAFTCLCRKCHYLYHRKFGVQPRMQTTTNRFVKAARTAA